MHPLSQINLLFSLLLITILCSAKFSESNQIYEEDFMQYSQSMMVSVRYDCQHKSDSTTHCCSGIILTESYVLTAADCVDSFPSDITIVAGIHNRSESDQIIWKIDKITIHPNWANVRDSSKYNIALLHVSNSLDFTIDKYIIRTSIPADLNLPRDVLNYPSNSAQLLIIQWNLAKQNFAATVFDNLQQNKMTFVDNNDVKCNELVDNVEQQFCIRFYNADSCNYESGESILQWTVNGWMQLGLINSVTKEIDGNCLKVYTRLAYYHKWIESILKFEDLTSVTAVTTTDLITNLIETYECNRAKVSCGCSMNNVVLSSMRIIGGEEAVPHSWSMTVSIRLNNSDQHSCGGSILSETYILTSAHCVDGALPSEVSVRAGMHNQIEDFEIIRYAYEIYIHPNWNKSDNTYQDDIAVVHILPPFPVGGRAELARTCVPYIISSNETINYPSDGSHLAVVGWGSVESDNNYMAVKLQQISMYTLDNNDSICLQSIHDVEKQFCAGIQGGDPCHGDEGGPIFQWKGTYWEQVGITSYGGKCRDADSPSVFTRLAYYFDWMESVTGISLTTTTTTTTTKRPTIPILYSCNKTSSCGCGKFDVALTSSRIVGGENAIENSWPMIVSLRLNEMNAHVCGGTILSNSYILTAAHCFRRVSIENPVDITIAAGMTNRLDPLQIIRNVDRIYIHPNYTGMPRDYRHDIALLHIDRPFTFESNSNVTKTCIHRIDSPLQINQHPKNGTRLSVIGWGTLQSGDTYLPEILQQAQVFTIDNEESTCVNLINNIELQFCAGLFEGGKDSCQGDSGGPIFQWTGQYWEQVGIVSYGNGCAQAGFPGIYTRLSYYYQWMKQILERDGEHLEPDVSPYVTTIKPDITSTFEMHSDTIISYEPSSVSSATSNWSVMTTLKTTTIASNSAYKYKLNVFIFGLSILLLGINQL